MVTSSEILLGLTVPVSEGSNYFQLEDTAV
jgi:hypothetical protein